jgi:hypothetical protein
MLSVVALSTKNVHSIWRVSSMQMKTDKPVQPLSRRQEALLESIASAFPDEIIDGDEAFRDFNRPKNNDFPIEEVIASAREREREAKERKTE